MSISPPTCPACSSTHIVKNGKIHNGKQNFKCRQCGRQFVQDPQNKSIDQATKTLIDKLLLERISLAGIARVVGVSDPWLPSYVNAKYQNVPLQVKVQAKKRDAWPSSVTRCGRLWATKATNSGFGWRWILKREKLSGCLLVSAVGMAHKDYGRLYLLCIDSVL